MSAHMIKLLVDHDWTVYAACFRPFSPVRKNGFVLSVHCFVAASPTKHVHGIAIAFRMSANRVRPEVAGKGLKRRF